MRKRKKKVTQGAVAQVQDQVNSISIDAMADGMGEISEYGLNEEENRIVFPDDPEVARPVTQVSNEAEEPEISFDSDASAFNAADKSVAADTAHTAFDTVKDIHEQFNVFHSGPVVSADEPAEKEKRETGKDAKNVKDAKNARSDADGEGAPTKNAERYAMEYSVGCVDRLSEVFEAVVAESCGFSDELEGRFVAQKLLREPSTKTALMIEILVNRFGWNRIEATIHADEFMKNRKSIHLLNP